MLDTFTEPRVGFLTSDRLTKDCLVKAIVDVVFKTGIKEEVWDSRTPVRAEFGSHLTDAVPVGPFSSHS